MIRDNPRYTGRQVWNRHSTAGHGGGRLRDSSVEPGEGALAQGRPAHRCRHGYTSAMPRPVGAPRNLCHHEDQLLATLSGLLAEVGALAETDGRWHPAEPVDVLRRERLQIVCTQQGATLRRDPPQELAAPTKAPGQSAFELEWSSRPAKEQNVTCISAHSKK